MEMLDIACWRMKKVARVKDSRLVIPSSSEK